MQKVADLHVHTYFSDGTFSPEKVVKYSKEKGLSAIAITDHDCCSGIAPAIKAGKVLGLEVISGVELSAELGEENIHILGYFIDWQDTSFVNRLEEISKSRVERAKKILKKLKQHKIDISEKELFEFSGPGSVGRLHIAHLLLKKGYISRIEEAFRKYIGDKGPCYVKNLKLSPREAMDMIKGVGGVTVLAHPKSINIKGRSVEDIVEGLLKDGLQGIEVYHPDHTAKDEGEFKKLAKEYNLLMTGGSDCHGFGKKGILIGTVKFSYELVESIKQAAFRSGYPSKRRSAR